MAQVLYTPYPTALPPATPPQDYQRIDSSPAMFGGMVAGAERQFGKDAEQASSEATQAVITIQNRHNQIASDDAVNSFMKYSTDATYGNSDDPNAPKGLYQLTGEDALRAGPVLLKQMEDKRQELKNNLENDAQRLQFENETRKIMNYKSGEIGRHLDQQEKTYATATNTSKVSNAARGASLAWNSDEAIKNSLDAARDGETKIAQTNYGEGVNSDILADARSKADTRVIHDAVQGALVGDPSGRRAQQILDTFGAGMNPGVRAQLTASIRLKIQGAEAKIQGAEDSSYLDNNLGISRSGTYTEGILAREGTGKNPLSSAQGYGGFTDSTWLDFAKANPSLFPAGASDQEILAQRNNRALGVKATEWYANANASALQDAGVDPTPENLAVAHTMGATGAVSLLNADPDAPAEQVLSPQILAANPSWRGQTAGALARQLGAPGRAATNDVAQYPDLSAMFQKIQRDFPDDPDRQARLMSQAQNRVNVFRVQTATDRANLDHTLPDLEASLQGGKDFPIPVDAINHLYPSEEAARKISSLTASKQAGQVYQAVQWGTPADIAAARQDLASGVGPISTMVRGKMAPPGTAQTEGPETPESYRQRVSIYQKFSEIVDRRDAALKADPAAYVAANPVVQQAAAAIDPENPATTQAYVNASLALQTQLGVKPEDQHVLTIDQAQRAAHSIAGADPAKEDAGASLNALGKTYGALWPQAFGDMVRLGKLSPQYQTLASIPDAGVRADYQRTLHILAEPGGNKRLEDAAGSRLTPEIQHDLNDRTDDFARTASVPGLSANLDLVANTKEAVRNLALYYMANGQKPSAAVQRAADGVFGNYDFGTTMRVPKGTLAATERAGDITLSNLKAADMMPMAVDTQATGTGAGGVELPGTVHLNIDARGMRPFAPGEWLDNPDKSWSNEITMTVQNPHLNGDQPTVVPSLWLRNGRPIKARNEDEAASWAADSGLTFPAFKTEDEAEKFADERESNWQKIPRDKNASVPALWSGTSKLGEGMTPAQRQEVTLRAARRGRWYTNESDNGLVLIGQDSAGRSIVMRRADGSRIELPFAQVSSLLETDPTGQADATAVAP